MNPDTIVQTVTVAGAIAFTYLTCDVVRKLIHMANSREDKFADYDIDPAYTEGTPEFKRRQANVRQGFEIGYKATQGDWSDCQYLTHLENENDSDLYEYLEGFREGVKRGVRG